MKEFFELTDGFAKRIEEIENVRRKIGDFLRDLNSSTKLAIDRDILEEKIIINVEKADLGELRIAGVDGGLVKQSLHGIDLMLLRAVGVVFQYSGNRLVNTEYHPEAMPSPIPKVIFDPFTDVEFDINSNYERQLMEINNAIEVVDKYGPDILFLNGSVIPHYTEKPAEHSLLFPAYQKLIEAYIELFYKSLKKRTILAGVIEDSRGTRFCEVVNQRILGKVTDASFTDIKLLMNRTKDTNLLTYALKLNERSFILKYSSFPEQHPILKEFGGKLANSIFSFYVKTAEFDRPIRVDFLADKEYIKTANKISSILLALVGHSSYGMPSIIIEADQRARLTEKDLELFYNDLITKTGNLASLFTLRREQRPF